MLHATKSGVFRSHYAIAADGQPVTVWDPSVWKSGGSFTLDGRRYRVKGNLSGSKYSMAAEDGTPLATADHVGRKRWTVVSEGQVFEFKRASIWGHDQALVSGGASGGSIRRTRVWRSDATAELPGLSLPLQVFILAVVLTMWDSSSSAAAGASAGAGGAPPAG